MAGFKTHLNWALAGGGILAGVGYFQGHIDAKDVGAVAILGTAGGLLPDLDSDTGKPLELLFQLLSVLVPMLLYPYVKKLFGADLTVMLLLFTLCYLMIHYLLCPLIKKLTVHRGIMHSIPFAILCGEATFLVFSEFSETSKMVTLYCAVAVTLGAFIHLTLDEFYSMSFKGYIPQFNRAAGTALAFYSSNTGATLIVYLLLISASYYIFNEQFNYTLNQLVVFIKG
ncbi:MAG: metal-dependent hydrolase [Desulfobacteraceae bacterium]|jgi:hypothetical protein